MKEDVAIKQIIINYGESFDVIVKSHAGEIRTRFSHESIAACIDHDENRKPYYINNFLETNFAE